EGHRVDVVGEALPDAGDALDLGLATQLSLGADLTRHARHLVGKRRELIDHRVDRLLEAEHLAADIDRVVRAACRRGVGGRAGAGVAGAVLRSWLARLRASVLTLSVRPFQTPDTPFTRAWPPSFPSVPTSRATRVTSSANDES